MVDKSPPPDLPPQELDFWNRLVLRDEQWIRAHSHLYVRPYKRRLKDLYLRRLEQERDEVREVRREETASENARLDRSVQWWAIRIGAVVALIVALFSWWTN